MNQDDSKQCEWQIVSPFAKMADGERGRATAHGAGGRGGGKGSGAAQPRPLGALPRGPQQPPQVRIRVACTLNMLWNTIIGDS